MGVVIKNPPLSADYVRSVLGYDPETGRFWWKVARGPHGLIPAGSDAGFINADGYRSIKFGERALLGHRLAWLIQTGEWPADEIDHRDLDRANNKWANLRAATHGQNQSNTKTYRSNSTGLKGAYYDPYKVGKFVAAIRKNGKLHHLGQFDTAGAAHAAYAAAAAEMHGEYGRAS